ncbi:hypothetical protein [Stenotrophomonas sp.]|uniref:hypothetical protein n=1 Tax=Stenotrophomonas sp. TaxID=69392 RepID=UPI0028B15E74|nr:hypothetical protein [Stenotrophomonas sp.]
MRQTSTVRVFSLLVLGVVTAVATSGCFFKRGARGDYALAPEARPLEVPPDLNLPNTSGATAIPALASATKPAAPAAAAPASTNGFTVSGSRDDVFGKVGEALAGIEGLTIASRAQLLGSYDVAYEGSNFLVRVVATDAGAYVSAVDPRGMPATDAAATKLVAALKGKLGG